jgi:hypothetical protein
MDNICANPSLSLLVHQKAAHSRLLWAAAFLPCQESHSCFVTGSRDQKLKAWSFNLTTFTLSLLDTLDFPSSITAISSIFNNCLLVGLESGNIFSVSFLNDAFDRKSLCQFPSHLCPASTVFFLAASQNSIAVSSSDYSLRLFKINKY